MPTVFNFLGPLANPARAGHQALGVADPRMAPVMAEVLRRTGTRHAIVLYGHDGLDELTTTTTSTLLDVSAGGVRELVLDPAELDALRRKARESGFSMLNMPPDLGGRDLSMLGQVALEEESGKATNGNRNARSAAFGRSLWTSRARR